MGPEFCPVLCTMTPLADKPKSVTKKVVPVDSVTKSVTIPDSVTPNVTESEPSVTKNVTGICPTCGQKIPKTHAQRQKDYRAKKKQK
jgi:hypothetical protein